MSAAAAAPPPPPAASLIAEFESADGERVGPQLDVPLETTAAQLGVILNQLRAESEPVPYSFYVGDTEVVGALGDALAAGQSTEQAVRVVFTPQAVFKVRAVTRCTSTLPGHQEALLSTSFDPSGATLATGAGDHCVRLWDVATELPRLTLKAHKDWVLAIAWSPCGRFLVSGGKDGALAVWAAGAGGGGGRSRGGGGGADGSGGGADGGGGADDSGGGGASSSSSSSAASPLRLIPRAHTKWVNTVAWEPLHSNAECTRFASASKDGSVKIWDRVTGRCGGSLRGHTASVASVKWGGCGLIYTASHDRTVKVWSAAAPDFILVRTLEGTAIG